MKRSRFSDEQIVKILKEWAGHYSEQYLTGLLVQLFGKSLRPERPALSRASKKLDLS